MTAPTHIAVTARKAASMFDMPVSEFLRLGESISQDIAETNQESGKQQTPAFGGQHSHQRSGCVPLLPRVSFALSKPRGG